MPVNYALYCSGCSQLPAEQMQLLAGGLKPEVGETERGITYTYRWPDLEIVVSEMPRARVAEHLRGFEGYVRKGIYRGAVPPRGEQIIAMIRGATAVVGFEIRPAIDQDGRAEDLLGKMCGGLRPMIFFNSAIYDWQSRLLLGRDQSFDPEAEIDTSGARVVASVKIEPPEFTPTANQGSRLDRSRAVLGARRIPQLKYALHTRDDAEVVCQTAASAARRALVLWAITLYADGAPQQDALDMLTLGDLWPYVSPKEERFIRNAGASASEKGPFVWRLEALWVLMWALGRIDALGWPAAMCDVPALVKVMQPIESDPTFVSAAKLRPISEILDAADLTMRIHWAIRDAWLNKRLIRSDLDWSAGAPDIAVNQSPANGVIEQRHHTLNWLTRFSDAEWDDVDTPT